jgi:L-amino acid N-acyltransferase YncA
MEIRAATPADWDAIWPIFHAVVSAGDTYVYAPETTKDEAFVYWMPPTASVYVAVDDDQVVGTYLFKPNQPGLGSHVANAAFMVSPNASRRGIGRAMGEHCLHEAKAAGYTAMQFNFVVSPNERAVALWKSLGFSIVGTLPRVFQHRTLGLVDAYVMHRFLDDIEA